LKTTLYPPHNPLISLPNKNNSNKMHFYLSTKSIT